MKLKPALLASVCASALVFAPALQAKPFKWSSQGEITTWDIHTANNALQNGLHSNVYESLLYYNSRTFKLEPVLATGWRQVSPTLLRISLRQGVKFHDGSAFTADDAVFSIKRAMSKNSQFQIYTSGVSDVVKVNDSTIDILTRAPNPVLDRQLTELRMMSKAWAEKNNSVDPWDIRGKENNFAHLNANGTGPFMLRQWAPDQRMVFARNPNWWGTMEGNVTELTYLPIKSDATRIAALLSGEVDMVLDPTPQDLGRLRSNANLRVIDGVENRTIFFGMDQQREELVNSNIKGKNPLKDVRVRRALYQAIDAEGITKSIMRGLGQPTGVMVAPQVQGWNEALHKRLPFDQDASKKLLAEAGYPNGFEVDFACPNNRYINDEEICQAVTAMWARIGVKAKLRTMPMSNFTPVIQRYEASIYMLGWGVPTFDGLYSIQSLMRTVGTGGDGNFNNGRYSNPRMDYIVDRVKIEDDLQVRNRLLTEALQLAVDTVAYLPLHNQVIPWAMKKNIDMVHRADNRLDMRLVKVN